MIVSDLPKDKKQIIKLLQDTTRSSIKIPTMKQAVKGHKISEVKLFTKDENRLNL